MTDDEIIIIKAGGQWDDLRPEINPTHCIEMQS